MVRPAMAFDLSEQSPLLFELKARGLLHQCTNLEELAEHLKTPRRVYAGFDPTKDSLTIGNLVSILLLRRFQLAGHTPVVVMGGGTGLIGDPSGKDAERQLMTRERINEHVFGQKKIFERLLSFDGSSAAQIENNADWIDKLSFVDVLRDVGKHFSVNMMIQKDSVKTRLTERDQGISYTEFSYMILQAYDFSWLFAQRGVTVEVGGSDQWGNIVAGVDLTRRVHQKEVFGLTTPLITKKDGGKFGKTESGAIWLTPDRTSSYAFYQFWVNAADEDLDNFLRVFSFKPVSEIEALLAEHTRNPGARLAQKALAEELTLLLHGETGLQEAQAATEALFSGNVAQLSASLIDEAFAGAPRAELPSSRFEPALSVAELLVETGVCKSKREARQFLNSGAISINGERVGEDYQLSRDQLLHGHYALIRRGKKTWHVVQVIPSESS